eukprot:15336223-Ditylum_brightwellii.AAC.1
MSEMTDVNPPPNIISLINVPDKCMVNPYSHGNKYNNNAFEIFVPVSNLLTIQNPYLPNGAHINDSKRMLKENGASSNIKQPPTPFSDKEEQRRMRLAGKIKSGLATNPMINKKCKKQIRKTTTFSPEHITKGYNLHNRMIKMLLNNPNSKCLYKKEVSKSSSFMTGVYY